jgi:hypothetical protein
VIVHVDMDCFFAAVATVGRPEFAGMCVGPGDPYKHLSYIVAMGSYIWVIDSWIVGGVESAEWWEELCRHSRNGRHFRLDGFWSGVVSSLQLGGYDSHAVPLPGLVMHGGILWSLGKGVTWQECSGTPGSHLVATPPSHTWRVCVPRYAHVCLQISSGLMHLCRLCVFLPASKPLAVCHSTSAQWCTRGIHVGSFWHFLTLFPLRACLPAGKPLAVCHSASAQGSGEVSTANYEARAFGIRAGMMIFDAKGRCPGLLVVPYEFEKYEEASLQVRQAHTPMCISAQFCHAGCTSVSSLSTHTACCGTVCPVRHTTPCPSHSCSGVWHPAGPQPPRLCSPTCFIFNLSLSHSLTQSFSSSHSLTPAGVPHPAGPQPPRLCSPTCFIFNLSLSHSLTQSFSSSHSLTPAGVPHPPGPQPSGPVPVG